MSQIGEIADLVTGAGKAIDSNTESGEERQRELTERLRLDMASDNKLSKAIRPLTLIWIQLIFTFILVAHVYGAQIDPWIIGQVTVLLGTVLGFYFNSKRAERISEKNATANIQIAKLKLKAELKQDRKDAKVERRTERRESKQTK